MKKVILILLILLLIFSNKSYGVMKSSPNYIILLVHGINSNEKCFTDLYGNFKGYLKRDLGLIDRNSSSDIQDGYIYLYHFSDPKGSSITSAKELGDKAHYFSWTERASNEYSSKFPDKETPAKFIIIAHSMGGLASRYYLTHDFYQNDVKKFISLDCPHAGADGFTWYERWEKVT